MQRVPEPELMNDPEQAAAYAQADFSEPHDQFVALFVDKFGARLDGDVLDLGCGPGDVCRRFATAVASCRVHGIDAAAEMLSLARAETGRQGLSRRVQYRHCHLPDPDLPRRCYDAVISNSMLHHLADPATLWHSARHAAKPGAALLVVDLMRPDNARAAQQLVEQYAAGEPAVLQRDFGNSLLAAYRPDEVREQLRASKLEHLQIEIISDRHLAVFGRLL